MISKTISNSQLSAKNHIHIVSGTVCTKCVYTIPVVHDNEYFP